MTRKTISFFFLIWVCSFCNPILGQNRARLTVATGVEVSTGKEISHVYPMSQHFNISLPTRVFRNLYIGPAANIAFATKKINESARGIYSNLGIGIVFEYEIAFTKNFAFVPGFRLMHEELSDKIIARKGYTGDPLNIISADGTGYSISTSWLYKHFVTILSYNIRIHETQFNKEFSDELEKYNSLYTVFNVKKHYVMNFSSFSVSVAYRL